MFSSKFVQLLGTNECPGRKYDNSKLPVIFEGIYCTFSIVAFSYKHTGKCISNEQQDQARSAGLARVHPCNLSLVSEQADQTLMEWSKEEGVWHFSHDNALSFVSELCNETAIWQRQKIVYAEF